MSNFTSPTTVTAAHRTCALIGAGLVALALAGCASPSKSAGSGLDPAPPAAGAAALAAAEAEAPVPVLAVQPPEPPRSLPVPIARRTPLPSIPVTEFDMGREADIATVLRALARAADVNLVLGAGVSGPAKLSLSSSTTWDRLFELIIETHALHYEYDDGLLRVMAKSDLDALVALERSLRERDSARLDRLKAEPREIRLYRVRYAEAGKLAEAIRQGLASVAAGESGGLTLVPDADSGTLVIQATPSILPQALELARSLDQPVYQVLIEASIVQANSETARELGVQWGARFNALDAGRVNLGTTSNPDGFNSNFPASFSPGDPGFSFGGIRTTGSQVLQVQLSALQKDGRLNIVSSPSITTLDLQTATIQSGEERPFQSSQGTGATTTAVVEFKEALLTLEVTPQVIDGRWIKLRIKTTKDDFDDSRPVLIDGTLQVPIIKRAATTMLYLADGQTTVIGGLSTSSDVDQDTGLPVLKDLPLVGRAFGGSSARRNFSDTLIFITPRILGVTPARGEPAPVSP